MKYVYQLMAKGIDWMTCESYRMITSSTVFMTRELAESRIEKFRRLCVEKQMLTDDYSITVTVCPLEVISE